MLFLEFLFDISICFTTVCANVECGSHKQVARHVARQLGSVIDHLGNKTK